MGLGIGLARRLARGPIPRAGRGPGSRRSLVARNRSTGSCTVTTCSNQRNPEFAGVFPFAAAAVAAAATAAASLGADKAWCDAVEHDVAAATAPTPGWSSSAYVAVRWMVAPVVSLFPGSHLSVPSGPDPRLAEQAEAFTRLARVGGAKINGKPAARCSKSSS